MLQSSSVAVDAFSRALSEFQRSLPQKDKSESPVLAPEIDERMSDARKNQLFVEALQRLSNLETELNDEEVSGFSAFFVLLYKEEDTRFRHMYSEVCGVMFGYLVESGKLDDGVPYQANKLANNVSMILEHMRVGFPEERAVQCVSKLYDHIELENKRMRYMTAQNKAQQNSADSLEKKFEETLKEKVEKASQSFSEDMDDKINATQRNYITILGIFAAIVVAFMSGTAFSSSVLENIDKASIYRISFVVLLVGFFMFNMICGLFMFLNKVSDIDNKAMLRLLKLVNALFIAFIVVVVVARAVDLVAIFPVLVQRLFGL